MFYSVYKKLFIDRNKIANKKEGINIISKEEIKNFDFDYIITFTNNKHNEIVEEARAYINSIGGFEKFAEWGLVGGPDPSKFFELIK